MADRLTRNAALERLRAVSDEIVDRVTAVLPEWVLGEVGRIADAWAGASGAAVDWESAARAAAAVVAERVGAELRALFASEPAAMARTPLEVVRTAVAEPTEVLVGIGIPPVDRDEFATRSWPDDRYGLMPATLADLGDPALGPLLLAWGMAKAAALRSDDTR
ncbi:MAG TPA: hypothetical protein VFW06_11550 [Acidimicrobiia bacterium]|nr:hypothetical protein [Acidimicrobiia bacterium]